MQVTDSLIYSEYKTITARLLKYSFPTLLDEEIERAINYSVSKRTSGHNDDTAVLNNNYTHIEQNIPLLELTEYIISREPILTAAGVMFKKHGTVPNPLYKMIENFIESRSKFKKEMFRYPKGSDDFKKFNLLQLLAKLDANALYGVLGMFSSLFFNIHIASSTTTQAKSCISAAALQFEAFLANNAKFGSLNEIVTYIDNVVNETPNRHFSDYDVLDENISIESTFYKLMSTCGFFWFPTKKECNIVWEMLCRLKQEDLNRLFYKNNLYSFMDNSYPSRLMGDMLCKLEKPFLNPNEVPKEIENEMNHFWDLLSEYVYYPYQYIDRIDRIDQMTRDVCIIMDTDSTILSLDPWYNYNLQKYLSLPMKIKDQYIDASEMCFGEEFTNENLKVDSVRKISEYDFLSDEIIEIDKATNPDKVIPQDNLRYSIINIMANCLSRMIVDYMERYTMNTHSYSEGKKCLLVMKNEFLFRRALNTGGKKNYTTLQEMQEGNQIPEKEQLDVKGMPIDKATLQEDSRNRLKKILYEDVLKTPIIDPVTVLKSLGKMDREIRDALIAGSKKYYKPVTVKAINNYENPMSIQGITASVVYNAIRGEDDEAIDLTARNSIDIIKVNINKNNIESLKESHPDKYEALLELFKEPAFKSGIRSIALPLNAEVPKWLLDYIDYKSIINDNIKNFPVESLGISRLGNTNVNYSNILSF